MVGASNANSIASAVHAATKTLHRLGNLNDEELSKDKESRKQAAAVRTEHMQYAQDTIVRQMTAVASFINDRNTRSVEDDAAAAKALAKRAELRARAKAKANANAK